VGGDVALGSLLTAARDGTGSGFQFVLVVVFFFQAEDGIRDFHVTGVQTCALPILSLAVRSSRGTTVQRASGSTSVTCAGSPTASGRPWSATRPIAAGAADIVRATSAQPKSRARCRPRSEEHTSELQSREKLVCRLLL